jgi:hypothetical protein
MVQVQVRIRSTRLSKCGKATNCEVDAFARIREIRVEHDEGLGQFRAIRKELSAAFGS